MGVFFSLRGKGHQITSELGAVTYDVVVVGLAWRTGWLVGWFLGS